MIVCMIEYMDINVNKFVNDCKLKFIVQNIFMLGV